MQVAGTSEAGNGQLAVLVLDDLSLSFGAIAAVSGVNLAFERGGRYGILGANGAGKTSLFNLICGEMPPSRGRLRLDGEDVTGLGVHERIRRGLRRTFQSSRVLRNLSVLENLVLAAQGVRRGRLSLRGWALDQGTNREAERLLQMSMLAPQRDRPAGELSHGQQRQLEISMGLAGNPKVILFDEPAAGLSPHERERLTSLLGNLPDDVCMLLIEHDLDIALRVARHITVMHHGQVFRQGEPTAIAADADVQAIYMGGTSYGSH